MILNGHIYKITNNINGKVYIGKTKYKNPKRRWYEHVYEAKADRLNYKKPLYDAIRKYGKDSFSFEVIESIYDKSGEYLNNLECRYIELFESCKNGYNSTLGGEGKQLFEEVQIIESAHRNSFIVEDIAYELRCSVWTVMHALDRCEIKYLRISEILNYSKVIVELNKNTKKELRIFSSAGEAAKYIMKDGDNMKVVRTGIKNQISGIYNTTRGRVFRDCTEKECEWFKERFIEHFINTGEKLKYIEL